jgi:glycosyltransferase involved in cell wall biosynthesis
MRVFVHLAYGMDAAKWQARWRSGSLIGVNEHTPYGYHHAERSGVHLRYSEDIVESAVAKVARLGVRGVLGFDLIHALRNRREMMESDVIWTHTESQHLAVLALRAFRSLRKLRSPPLIAQSVWLFDGWPRIPTPRSQLNRALMNRAEVLTVLSDVNAALARKLFPSSRVEVVRFGIKSDPLHPVRREREPGPLRVAALGNDRHRDWRTLVLAAVRDARFEVVIASQTAPALWGHLASNVTVARLRGQDDLERLFDWADVVVVPLKKNLHASGITVVLEAVVRGLPVICTNVGGIDGYFSSEHIEFAKPGSVSDMRAAIARLASDLDRARDKAVRAQQWLQAKGLTSVGYAQRHAELSRELLTATASNHKERGQS